MYQHFKMGLKYLIYAFYPGLFPLCPPTAQTNRHSAKYSGGKRASANGQQYRLTVTEFQKALIYPEK